MGHRSNLVIIENGHRTVYYDRWAAINLDAYIFWGEKVTVEYIRSHKSEEDYDGEPWSANEDCERAVLVDLDQKYCCFLEGWNFIIMFKKINSFFNYFPICGPDMIFVLLPMGYLTLYYM